MTELLQNTEGLMVCVLYLSSKKRGSGFNAPSRRSALLFCTIAPHYSYGYHSSTSLPRRGLEMSSTLIEVAIIV